MKYVSFPCPPMVVAPYRKWFAWTQHSNWRSGSRQTILVPSIQLCPCDSFQTVQETISDPNRIFYDNE